ncbi:hypothetical protein [Pseudomonas fluorescens]|uniref:Uncharacterized protein n=1 Tax=Pseudomonas fluorescens TaxID=294 RepID=A0A0F4TDH0_PSEFL|nr:hypothetical protein [Pseudomonas fluorescens]KJZ42468.1 hypothetical protein VC35_23410 [Pseudomonas fluorescens]
MSVRLDTVPARARRPARPRVWLWLGLLLLCLLFGIGGSFLFTDESLDQQPVDFWSLALGLPLLGWCVLGFARVLLHIGKQAAADGWDDAREKDLTRRLRKGRRSQQILGVSCYTALRDPSAGPVGQLDALLNGNAALKAQPFRIDGAPLSHSRLDEDLGEDLEAVFLSVLTRSLADLAPVLSQLPDDKPIALLLDVDCRLPEDQWLPAWRNAWRESGIRQSVVPVEGRGLAAVDRWLDQRIDDQALLMVLAVQLAPDQPEGTAEVAVGLLFGNRLTQSALSPIAYLHRPEQQRQLSEAGLLGSARQALDWAPLLGQSIEKVWRAGVGAPSPVESVLRDVLMPVKPPQNFCNLDALLGHAGKASPWLAIAAAAQTIERGAGPQFIFSGGTAVDGLWSTVLMPVSPLSK